MVAPGVLEDEDAVEGVWEGAVCWLCAAARAGYITSEATTAIAMHWAINDFVIETSGGNWPALYTSLAGNPHSPFDVAIPKRVFLRQAQRFPIAAFGTVSGYPRWSFGAVLP